MSKFVIEPYKIYDVNFCSVRFFIRVIERCYSDYKVVIACYPDFDDSLEADEVEEYEEA